jgi:RNA polymerase primary sigma factor
MAEKSARSKEIDTELSLEQAKEQITALGKQKGVLSYDTIAEKLSKFDVDADQMDEFYDQLTEQGIQLVEQE